MNELTIVGVEDTHFQIDYKENLAVAFKMFEEIAMDLKKETRQELSDELHRVDMLVVDIEHIIELTDFNASQGYKFAKMIQQAKRARRKIKDRMEERTKIKGLIDSYTSKGFRNQLTQHLGSAEGREERLNNRSYRLRELNEVEGFREVIDQYKDKLDKHRIA